MTAPALLPVVVRLALRLAALVLVAAPIVLRPAVVQSQASRCANPMRVENKSFRQLGAPARLAYVWVDDIGSNVFGGFDPFEIHVVTGQAYAPFQAASGPMERGAFLRLTQDAYNVRRHGPVRVSPQNRTTARLAFVNNRSRFVLKVTDVQTSLLGNDVVLLQLCW